MQLNDKFYNFMKWLVLICLPAFSAAYFSLSDLWGLPKAFEVVGTIAVIQTLLGTLVGVSSYNYSKTTERHAGVIAHTGDNVDTGIPDLALTVTKDPRDLVAKKRVVFEIQPPPPSNQ